MSIKTGDAIPDASFKQMTPDGIVDISTRELFEGKKVVLFAVPGAMTPTCSEVHMPGFIENIEAIKSGNVDTVACLAVNDVFVINEWRKARSIPDDIVLLSDGNGEFTSKVGLELDASRFGMGTRSRRYAAIVDDGVLTYLGVEPAGEVGVSGADAVLEQLG
ncbi:MAG: peroxiredoxin [Holophagales bacterium]|nr:peroxiredoxin [Holophagales bacterium]MXX61815.1 peroxiredoxin [Holophagales bacterium]MYA07083.1 peroxiredoxin [Holophagales bacterium]MYB18921.1 peroxiredoxin [Holophagales bacterium]MYC09438.1 peroxiredoxin [Holophagales bacterium]